MKNSKNRHGGFRQGAGRPKGSRNKATLAREARQRQSLADAAAANANLSPVDFLLQVARDPAVSKTLRTRAAKAAAPYLEARMVQRRGK